MYVHFHIISFGQIVGILAIFCIFYLSKDNNIQSGSVGIENLDFCI